MIEKQRIEEIPPHTLLERVQGMLASGCRLVQICCTRLAEDHEMNYSFDSGQRAAGPGGSADAPNLHTLRVRLPLENP